MGDRKDAALHLKVSDEDRDAIKEQALKFRVAQAEYIRKVLQWAVTQSPKDLIKAGVMLPLWPDLQ